MAVSSDEALVGRTLDGRYVIGKRIARGGMASVFMATDKRLDRVVAVKVMHSGLGDDDQFTDRFVREARSAAKLNHPNVVSVFDQGTDGDVTYLVMEYVPGQTLRDVMRDEAPMPPGRALALIEQVLIALSAAHAAHLIHRDVKPENVLIAPDGSTKVADFGLARAVSAATTATGGTLIGTVSYLAPEIVVNEGADARSDVYACGAVLYEMLTGFKPHAGDSPIQVAYKHVHEDIAKPSATIEGIPPYVDALVIRATARNRDQRSADASVMLKQVRQVRRALNAGLEDDPELTLDLLPSVIRHDEEETQAVDREAVAAVGLAAAAASRGAATAVVASSASSPESTAVAPFGGQPTKPHAPNAPTGLHPAMPLSEFHQVKKSAPRRRRGLILLVVALVVALLAGLGGWYYGVGRYVDAPQLVGLSLAQATSEAKAAGFPVNVKESAFDEEIPKGDIISSAPSPGDRILPGDTIDLVVSKGQERYGIPDLSGKTVEQAAAILDQLNLKLGEQTQKFSEKVKEGLVLKASDFAVDTKVKRGTIVDINVSKGRKPIAIVDYTGKTEEEATKALKAAGFTVTSNPAFSDTIALGRVISQDPKEGEGFKDTLITLTVSEGPEFITVPNVVGQQADSATSQLEALGFKVRKVGSGTVVGQTANGEKRKRGDTITIACL